MLRDAPLQPSHCLHARLLEQVAVEVGRDLDRGVAELAARVLDALPLVDEERGVSVPELGVGRMRVLNRDP